MYFGWEGELQTFVNLPKDEIIDQLTIKYPDYNNSQLTSWKETIDYLHSAFKNVDPNLLNHWQIIFEYQIPGEGGRRPDLIFLSATHVLIIEIKNKKSFTSSDFEQIRGYTRDIYHYHYQSRCKKVNGLLLLLQGDNKIKIKKNIKIISQKTDLISTLKEYSDIETSVPVDVNSWMQSRYEPIPSLIIAAKQIFTDNLNTFERIRNAGIPKVIDLLKKLAIESKNNKQHTLILISGVPGSGKTLVGLQFVHEYSQLISENRAVYLSGNGPLITVLRYILGDQSKVFIRSLYNYKHYYAQSNRNNFEEHVIVFDEAQRAWDKNQMYKSTNRPSRFDNIIDKSEPEMLISLAEENDWGMIVGLIGDGQEIHTGEEGGIELWYDAISKSNKKWDVFSAKKLIDGFSNCNKTSDEILVLDKSLRTHYLDNYHKWIKYLLNGDSSNANREACELKDKNFYLYITKNVDDAKKFMIDRYNDDGKIYDNKTYYEKTFGMLISSLAKNYRKYNIHPSDIMKQSESADRQKFGQWYYKKSNRNNTYCRTFNRVMSEFGSQGLETDAVILCWGDDYYWDNSENKWKLGKIRKNKNVKDVYKLRLNSYRVLLSRARDGIVVVCKDLDDTYDYLMECGFEELKVPINSLP